MEQRIYILYIVMAAILMVGCSGGSDKNTAWDESAALMSEAEEGVFNDVICGHHWKSDIDAGQQLAAVVFAAVSASEAYQAQLKKAREEYQRIIAEKETPACPPSVHDQGLSASTTTCWVAVWKPCLIARACKSIMVRKS